MPKKPRLSGNTQLLMLEPNSSDCTLLFPHHNQRGGLLLCLHTTIYSEPSPLPNGIEPTAHGYITCIVLSNNADDQPTDEFWVFHADNFSKPIYRLSASDAKPLNLALTLHSTWLQEIYSLSETERRQRRRQSIYEDYNPLLQSELCFDLVYGK